MVRLGTDGRAHAALFIIVVLIIGGSIDVPVLRRAVAATGKAQGFHPHWPDVDEGGQ